MSSSTITPDRALAEPSGTLTRWAISALFVAAALFVGHTAVVLFEARLEASPAPDLALWHVGITALRSILFALVIAALAAGLAIRLGRKRALAVLLCAALFLAALTGWPIEDPHYLPEAASQGLGAALLLSAVAAIVLAVALVLLVRRTSRLAARPSVLLFAVFVAAAIPVAVYARFGRQPPLHTIREPVRELLSGTPDWTVVSSPPGKLPRAGTLAPSVDVHLDSGDLPALIMPPPCEVRFVVRPEDGPVFLRASAGVDRRVKLQLPGAPADAHVDFEIAVNGSTRFEASLPVQDKANVQRSWHPAGGHAGLALAPGDVVTLRTSLSPPDLPVKGEHDLFLGFGQLVLERAVSRPYRRSSAEEPNLVLIVMDTLRADELSCYGHPGGRTPVADALAARGVLYERAYATSSWTWPSTTSILTGLPPETHGVVDDEACYLDHRVDTLAEALVQKDLATGAFVCNPLLDPNKNFGQGFESYESYREFRLTEPIVDSVDAWLGAHAGARFFLYLHLVDPHEYDDPSAEDLARVGATAAPLPGKARAARDKYRKALLRGEALEPDGLSDAGRVVPAEHQRRMSECYSAAVCSGDRWLGEILRRLEAHGLRETTVVAFTSDHGEELFDHGLLGHDQTIHEELVRVPLILAGPGIPRGVRTAVPVQNSALAWTLARRAGAEIGAAPARIDLTLPGSVPSRTLTFSTEHGWWNGSMVPIRGIQEGSLVLHFAPRGLPPGAVAGADPGDGQIRLYDLASDPEQHRDLAAQRAADALALRQRWLEHEAAATAERRGTTRGAGAATREMLRRFGYTGEEDPATPR